MIDNLKLWLAQPCKEEDVRYLEPDNPDPDKRGAYIPIGVIEQTLDELDSWNAFDFKHQITKAGGYWISDASVQLVITHDGKTLSRPGSVSFFVSSRDSNVDFAATALSFCIANAAKKLGKKFGRHLNGRLNKGETGIPIIQIQNGHNPETIDEEFTALMQKLDAFEFQEDAREYLETTSFKYYIPAKNLVNLKPNKI